MKLMMLCKHGSPNTLEEPCETCVHEEQAERRAALNMNVDVREVAKTLRLTAQLLSEFGWCSIHQLHPGCAAMDVPQALSQAVLMAGSRGGMWRTARAVLMDFVGADISLARWNDMQTDANKVITLIEAAANDFERSAEQPAPAAN